MPSSTPDAEVSTSLASSILSGAWRFALTGVGAFAVWAFAGGWFHENGGEAALFAAVAAAFIGLAGLTLAPLLPGPRRVARFYRVFVPAFLAYAVVWSASWFLLGFGLGEWLGSLLGCVSFVAIAGWLLGNRRPIPVASVVLFAAHSLGYFAGGALMGFVIRGADGGLLGGLSQSAADTLGKLSWGLAYGLGFGAGLGYLFRVCRPRTEPERAPAT
jgi:hypothetical protein